MSKTPWIVLDAKAQVMRCDRCAQTEPLSLIEGKRLDLAAGILMAFNDVHEKCEAVKP